MNKGKLTVTTAILGGLILSGCSGGAGLAGSPPDAGPADTAAADLEQAGNKKDRGPKKPRPDDPQGARNIILMVGDGMGTAQRNAIRLSHVGLTGELVMDSLPELGLVHTNSADPETFVTDSAAAATTMSTGVKTYNGAIGVDLNGVPVPTALEIAAALGKSTGLVTTAQVTDATPAAFGSHVADRGEQSEIARQFLESSRPDLILGGGEDHWYPVGNPGRHPDNPPEDPSEESTGPVNLVEQAQADGYEYVWDEAGLLQAQGPKVLGLFANEEMFQYGDDVDEIYEPTVPLTTMTQKALELLSSPASQARHGGGHGGPGHGSGPGNGSGEGEGFFLLVEDEGIDSMSHVNDAGLTIKSGIAFEQSVAVARDFAEADGNTLLIVVGDHQTGGMTIEAFNDTEDESGDGISAEDGPFPVANSDQVFSVDWTTDGHTALDVPLTAMGPGSEKLGGFYEDTHIFDVMVEQMRTGVKRSGLDLQSHRGGRGEFTEESLAAFRHSLELGVSTLELDTHLSEDGAVVVWHDDIILGTKCRDTEPVSANDPDFPYVGDRVAELTLAQLKSLDCGFTQLPGYPEQQVVEGNRIAELKDVFALVRELRARSVGFNIETKVEDGRAGGPGMEALTRAVVREVKNSGMADRVTIQSFDWSALNLVGRLAPRLDRVALVDVPASLEIGQPGAAPILGGIDIDDYGGSAVKAAAAQGYDVISPIYTSVTRQMVTDAHEAGMKIVPWTVNEPAVMNYLIDLGVDGIITDYPTRLRLVMEQRGIELPRAYGGR
ncbi:alkaline phosphatase [Arthrobacter koreensis]|uniref:alkaline phosphatase n=1 Tax=Arthrobacter koreensis TaxID=199136 RepID=UPI002DB858D0|nr:alkaline phosphatase [Arthrobacter koreensis]MEB7504884.1 alkaline phosphatase [Arthrobacter koreensis]